MQRKILIFAIPLGIVSAILFAAYYLHGSAAEAVITGIPVSLVLAFGLAHGLSLPSDYLGRWGKSHGIAITPENEATIRRYVLRGRRIRSIGALAGYVTYVVVIAIWSPRLPFGWLTCTFAGYLLGAAAAEVWAARPERGAVRSASLTPRRLTDYVPRTAVVLMRGVPIATLVLSVCYPIIPTRPELAQDAHLFGAGIERPELLPVIGWTLASVVLWALVELTARRIVSKPQPAESVALISIDDAIRSTALHGMIGAGLALMLGALSRSVSAWSGLAGPQRLAGLFSGIAIVTGFGSIFAWLRLGIDQQWVVKRSRPDRTVQAA